MGGECNRKAQGLGSVPVCLAGPPGVCPVLDEAFMQGNLKWNPAFITSGRRVTADIFRRNFGEEV